MVWIVTSEKKSLRTEILREVGVVYCEHLLKDHEPEEFISESDRVKYT